MIVLTKTEETILLARQSIIFDKEILHTGRAEITENNSSMIKLRYPGIYMVSFSGNISAEESENPLCLGILKNGEVLPETKMYATALGVDFPINISTQTRVRVEPDTIPVLELSNLCDDPIGLIRYCSFIVQRVG